MEFFDINAKLGNWPYRPVNNIDYLLKKMDRYHISKACVSSLSAVHDPNPQKGNLETFNLIKPYLERLYLIACINIKQPNWEKVLYTCTQQLNAKGIILYPTYHNFSLHDPELERLVKIAKELRLPIFIQNYLEDPRRQFNRKIFLPLCTKDIENFITRYPTCTVVLLGMRYEEIELLEKILPQNVFFDTSAYEHLNDLEHAIQKWGASQILFGTNFPLFNIEANILKLLRAGIPHPLTYKIAFQNALKLI